jgi:hypothetical protein
MAATCLADERSRTAGFCGVVAGSAAWRSIAKLGGARTTAGQFSGAVADVYNRSVASPRSAKLLLAGHPLMFRKPLSLRTGSHPTAVGDLRHVAEGPQPAATRRGRP